MQTETFETNRTETNPQILIDRFFETFFGVYSREDEKKIREAWAWLVEKTSGINRPCGSPYYLHPMRVACALAKGRLGWESICAAFFHNLQEFDPDCMDEIARRFGDDVAKICSGTSKITSLKFKSSSMQQSDAIRKMLFAMVDDIRVILVKTADRLDRMRNLKSVDAETQKQIASEVMEIWAPLADRLGMNDAKNEMEDLALKYLHPKAFQQIKSFVALKKGEREDYLKNAVKKIQVRAEKMGISVSIASRAKHFYSIYQKMRKRNKEPGELFDLLALRIICGTEAECYTLVGIVHSLWKPMEGRFKDYIAMPKANGYQSLHTTVICEGMPLEIQIRTQDMHNIAEHGVASHWLYKKGTNKDMVRAEDLSIINQLMELRKENVNDDTFFQTLKDELLGDSIYVFTPRGDVKQLPLGANAIDFAYAIHSGIGEKIVGAKADGKIIPITAELKNTQIVEILTNPQAHPTQAQLKSVKTGKARQKIHSWLAANDPTFIDRDALAKKEADSLAHAIHSREIAQQRAAEGKSRKRQKSTTNYTGLVQIDGDTNYMVTIAKCCCPQPGEPIVGYVSRNRGVTIHLASCLTFLRIPDIAHRTVEVKWDMEKNEAEGPGKNGN